MDRANNTCDPDNADRASLSPPMHSNSQDEDKVVGRSMFPTITETESPQFHKKELKPNKTKRSYQSHADHDDIGSTPVPLQAAPRQASIDAYDLSIAPKMRGARVEKGGYNLHTIDDRCETRMPGAIRERGYHVTAEPSTTSFSSDGQPSERPILSKDVVALTDADVVPIEAHVVSDDDIEGQVEDRFRQRADLVADQIMERLRQNVVEAEQVEVSKESKDSDSLVLKKRRRRHCIVGSTICAVLLIVTIIVVVVVLVTRKPSTLSPSTASTVPPSPPATTPPTKPTSPTSAPTRGPDLHSNVSASILEVLESGWNHGLFVQYWNTVGYMDILSDENLTVFAPTDDSFEALQEVLPFQYYLTDSLSYYWKNHLLVLLGTNIIAKPLNTHQIFGASFLPTYFSGFSLAVNVTSRTIGNGARLVQENIQARNGFVHVPDRVIIYPQLNETLKEIVLKAESLFNFEFDIFPSLLRSSGFLERIDQNHPFGFTVIVPTDDAFQAMNQTSSTPNDTYLILYHMAHCNRYIYHNSTQFMSNNVTMWFTTGYNSETFLNGVKTLGFAMGKNGVAYFVDRVMVPPDTAELLEITADVTTSLNCTTFVDIVNGPSRLGKLFRGEVAGYSNLGNEYGDSYLTVFAPLETAFDAVADSFDRWLQPQWLRHLQSVVRHHFTVSIFKDLPGDYNLTMFSGYQTTLQVWTEATSFSFGNYTIDDANVQPIDGYTIPIMWSQSDLILIIDKVMLPPWVSVSIYTQLVDDANFAVLISLIRSMETITGLLNDTNGAPWTLLAPNNTAFESLGATRLKNATFVRELISRHILRGNVYADNQNSSLVNVITWNNQTVTLQRVGNDTFVRSGGVVAKLLETNWLVSNGVVHVIDRVLLASP